MPSSEWDIIFYKQKYNNVTKYTNTILSKKKDTGSICNKFHLSVDQEKAKFTKSERITILILYLSNRALTEHEYKRHSRGIIFDVSIFY